ncbi:acyl-CoA dehydrogenase family protein [Niveispirillum sp.]|uniref:acyl-CoA dehydrogenase family protein n=1 Tax=Niveispirillum sp. TaxID=1917217 RepID=UPI001B3CECC3|nr:acyl-CoA dehydrogenase family protein [Niveispirillum sp.]MBP7337898.1 acyl-CoA dehydrogenase family protein [Niveispirillum sp.]
MPALTNVMDQPSNTVVMRKNIEESALPEKEYQEFKTQIFEAIWRDLDPLEEEIENNEHVPHEIVDPLLRNMGAFGLLIPKRYGGIGLSTRQYLPILSEFSKIQGGIRVLVHVHNSASHGLLEAASEEMLQEILPDVAQGRKSVAFGLTEPDHGTGMDIGTTAVRDGDDYVINGRKWLITNSDIASHFIIICKTDSSAGAAGISAILVDRGTPGFTITPLPETMGCKGGEHGQLDLVNVRVPANRIIGKEGQGLTQMEELLEISRVFIAATSLGTAERSFELSLAFAKRRVTFGKPIGSRQAIQRYLAEMGTDIYALRGMIDDAANKWDQGRRIPAEASMCKLFGLEAVGRVTDRALLIHGGIGYTRAHRIERLYRDARLNWLEEGPPTIQIAVAAGKFLSGYDWNA